MAKMGRPRKKPGERRTTTVAFRLKPELKAELEAAAKANNSTVTAEIEMRLQFNEDLANSVRQMQRDFGGEFYAMMFMIREALRGVEKYVGKTWVDDPWLCWLAGEIARGCFGAALVGLGEIERPEHLFEPAEGAGPGAPKLYGGEIDESELGNCASSSEVVRIMQSPDLAMLKDLSARELDEWQLMVGGKATRDAWIKKNLGQLRKRLEEALGPLGFTTPERLRRRIALHREKRIDPEGYKARIERERKPLKPGPGFLPTTPPDGLVLGATGERKKSASGK